MKTELNFVDVAKPLQDLMAIVDPGLGFKDVKSIYVGHGENGNTALIVSSFVRNDEGKTAGVLTKEYWLKSPPLVIPE